MYSAFISLLFRYKLRCSLAKKLLGYIFAQSRLDQGCFDTRTHFCTTILNATELRLFDTADSGKR